MDGRFSYDDDDDGVTVLLNSHIYISYIFSRETGENDDENNKIND